MIDKANKYRTSIFNYGLKVFNKFSDVFYFETRIKQIKIETAETDTLKFSVESCKTMPEQQHISKNYKFSKELKIVWVPVCLFVYILVKSKGKCETALVCEKEKKCVCCVCLCVYKRE